MRKTGSLIPALLLLAAALASRPAAAATAAAAGVSAEVSSQKIGLEDLLLYTLTFRDIENPEQPDLSYLDDFRVLQTSRSSEFQFRDGASTTLTRFTYYLMPTRSGRLVLPPLRFSHQGRQHETRSFAVEVVSGSLAANAPAPPAPSSLFDDDFFASPFRGGRQGKIDAFLRADISKPACLRGEQLIFRVLLYTRNQIESVNMVSGASFPGFWQEWFPAPATIVPAAASLNGTAYRVYEIRKAALFANESGRLTIPPLQFELQLAAGDALLHGARVLLRSSEEIQVQVGDPPQGAGLPVGRFSFALEAPPAPVAASDIVTLRMTIRGSGNCKAIAPPPLPASDQFLAYPPQVVHETDFTAATLSGTLRAEIPIALQRAGDVEIPPLEFRYYDPELRRPVSLFSEPLRLQVGGARRSAAGPSALPGGAVVREGEDIDYIRSAPLSGLAPAIHRRAWFRLLLAALFAVNLLTLFKVRVWDRMIAASPARRRRRALARSLKALQAARRPEEIAPIMEEFFCTASGIGRGQVGDRLISEWLQDRGLPSAEIDRFLFLRGQSELARFSPAKKSGLELERDRRELRSLLRAIERRIP